ncbi:MAG: GNAT family acetyltransferase [Chthoniobacteraceae bacterium]
MSTTRKVEIRRYEPADREAIRALCCDTGFLGKPIDPAFEDRELFADYLTSFYTDCEPESAFVLAVDGEVRGYLLGSRRPFLQQLYNVVNNLRLLAKGAFRYGRYNAASKKFIRWILTQAWREVPAVPRKAAHFHFNILPDSRKLATTRALTEAYFEHLRACGETRVYGQVVVFEDRRGAKLFERYGFKVLNKSEITKYRHLHPQPVYLCTVLKELA